MSSPHLRRRLPAAVGPLLVGPLALKSAIDIRSPVFGVRVSDPPRTARRESW